MLRSMSVLLLLASSVGAETRIDLPRELPARPGRVIVELERGAKLERLRQDVALIDQRAGKRALQSIRREYRHALHGAALEVPAEAVEALRRLPYVRGVHPDMTVKAYEGQASGSAAAPVRALSLPTRGEGMVVAVIDTGIDYNHDALGGGFGPGHKVAGGWDFVNGDGDPMDDAGHGTHVAGIIAGDSAELTGVAPGVTLHAYKVLNGAGFGSQSDIIAGIERSMDPNQDGDLSDRVDVINLSLGGPGTADDPVSRAVDRATAAGVTVVVAAGNAARLSSIGSPGTARTAITVGATMDNGDVAFFSSRGPGPALLTFKPDVVAPGFEILSAQAGGGLVRHSGTSMAAPYVAGVAALLRKLHPGWTPSDIRSALVTTAFPNAESPLARGAGRIDAERAAAVTMHVDTSGISFGLASATEGIWEQRRVVTVTNRAAVARTVDIQAVNTPEGAVLIPSPMRLELAPGASQMVELTLYVTAAAAFPQYPTEPVLGSVILFQSENEAFSLPWMVMRAARLTIATDAFGFIFLGMSADMRTLLFPYDGQSAELFGPPGSTWDFLIPAFDGGDEFGPDFRLLFAGDRMLAGDSVVSVPSASASAELVLDARDEHGRPLREVERARGGSGRLLTLILDYDKGVREPFAFSLSGWGRVFASPMPFALYPFQYSLDAEASRVYNIQYPRLPRVTESKTLTAGGSEYLHTVVRFDLDGAQQQSLGYCFNNGVRIEGKLGMRAAGCPQVTIGPETRVHYYTTSESGDGASGVGFLLPGKTLLPPLRGIGGAVVATGQTPSPADYRIGHGEEITIGGTPLFPRTFAGTTGGYFRYDWGFPAFYGPYNQLEFGATDGTPWTLYDAQGNVKAEGVVDPLPGQVGEAGERFVAVREGLKVAGLQSRAELEVRFGSDATDLMPPTFTSLRIESAQGRVTDRVPRGSAAALRFSAADLDYREDAASSPMRTEATRVWYRTTGTAAWHPLPVTLQGSDSGSFATLGRLPAGDLYRADLSSIAAVGPIDLRIELEDARGNRTSWTQAPAFTVSAPKGRAVSR